MNNIGVLVLVTLLTSLSLACSGFSAPASDGQSIDSVGTPAYQPSAEVYQELRSLYDDPNQTRFLSYDKKEYELWGRIEQVTVERIPETEEEFWLGTGEPIAQVRMDPDIVCFSDDVDNKDLQALQVGQIAVLNGQFNAEFSFSENTVLSMLGLEVGSDDAIFGGCRVVVVDYQPPTPTPPPTPTTRPTPTLRYGIGEGPLSVEKFLETERTSNWTYEEAHGLKVGGVFNSQCRTAPGLDTFPGVDYVDLHGLIIIDGEACLMVDNMRVSFPESNPARPRLGSRVYVHPLNCNIKIIDETGQSELSVILDNCDSIEVMN